MDNLKLAVSVLCYNKAEVTQTFLKHIEKTKNADQVQWIFTNNGSRDKTALLLANTGLPNKKIITHNRNIGFPQGHNHALTHAKADYFLALNNDLMIKDPDWIPKALVPLDNPKVGLVGLKGTPSELRPDGQGGMGSRQDYVEGSFVLGRTEDFGNYGLFSNALQMYVYEDSDLSLRFRQMGFELAYVGLHYVHKKHETLHTIPSHERQKHTKHNRAVFQSRWGNYLSHRRFFNKIRIEIPTVGIGDVLAATPTIAALRQDHPTAEFQIATQFPEVFENSPRNVIARKSFDREKVDRTLVLNPNYGSTQLLARSYGQLAHTVLGRKTPEIWTTEQETLEALELFGEYKEKRKVLCSFFISRSGWDGRSWTMKHAKEFLERARQELPELVFVEVGKDVPQTGRSHLSLVNKTSLRQLFALAKYVAAIVTIDSVCLHIAQAFGISTVTLFGATLPESRIGDPNSCRVVHSGVGCLGCYQKKQKPGFNKCDRKDEICMSAITPHMVIEALKERIQ